MKVILAIFKYTIQCIHNVVQSLSHYQFSEHCHHLIWKLYEVKWALGSITMNKASGGDGIPV